MTNNERIKPLQKYSSAKLINVRLKWIKESTLPKPKGTILRWTYVEKKTHTHNMFDLLKKKTNFIDIVL